MRYLSREQSFKVESKSRIKVGCNTKEEQRQAGKQSVDKEVQQEVL
jgi:hypothetical protein